MPRPKGPDTKAVNWRVRKDLLDKLEEEAQRTGYATKTALLHIILVNRYYGMSGQPTS